MDNKALLMILDGYGHGRDYEYNAVTRSDSPFLKGLWEKYPVGLLKCSGEAVGLPAGQMGNSEVGHMNIGSGRVIFQDLSRISNAIADGSFFENPALTEACRRTLDTGGALHLMGLVSDGGVHSSLEHLFALVDLAKRQGVKDVFIHCFMDGRDTLPTSGAGFIQQLEEYLEQKGTGRIASVSGRYYAMDRDSNYDRIQKAYDALTLLEGEHASSAGEAVRNSYEKGVTDEFIVPCVIDGACPIRDGDSVVFFNFRADRARQLTRTLTEKDFTAFGRRVFPDVYFVCMTLYDETLRNVSLAYGPEIPKNTLGEYLSSLGVRQFRIAETEKYAHVTYFFDGGVEEGYPLEEKVLIPSPKVATYDLKPEMSAFEVTDRLIEAMDSGEYGCIVVNYANCDMVGHTGSFEAAKKAVEAVDGCVRRVYEASLRDGYTVMVTADHGNAEVMMENGEPITSHTTNDVFFCVMSDDVASVSDGSLRDIAPTVLDVMGLKVPSEMTGKSLIERKHQGGTK
ncbi:MAG: 2,3-bisphosphoglycerate-independent phosphoglycerate mutase [Eubacteriaceae bacterium]|nr:2,3-bisphosphoglycerate-independent phosphoglycerate mutase [Eubacteriaceae bacterium]